MCVNCIPVLGAAKCALSKLTLEAIKVWLCIDALEYVTFYNHVILGDSQYSNSELNKNFSAVT